MRQSLLSLHSISAAIVDASSFMSSRPRLRPHYRGGGRNQPRRFSNRPQPEHQFVSGDSHIESVRDANLGFRRGGVWSSNDYNQIRNQIDNNNNVGRIRKQSYEPRPITHLPFTTRPSVDQYQRVPPPPELYVTQQSYPPRAAQQQFQTTHRRLQRPKPADYRRWEYAKTQPPPDYERFVVLSYNILADYLASTHRSKLYFHIPRHLMDWGWRKKNILFELGLWSPDIMCFQEVDQFQDLEIELRNRGYSGLWKMRTGDAIDGCAIFWRTSRFKLVHEEGIEFNKLGLRDNVAQICVLEEGVPQDNLANKPPCSLRAADRNRVVICNIHVLYNPRRGEIKLGQVRVLLDRAHAVSKIWDNAPVVICGDFNSTPKSPLYNYILEQKLDLSEVARDKVSGQASAEIGRPSRENNAGVKSAAPALKDLDEYTKPEDSSTGKSKQNEMEIISANIVQNDEADSKLLSSPSISLDVTHASVQQSNGIGSLSMGDGVPAACASAADMEENRIAYVEATVETSESNSLCEPIRESMSSDIAENVPLGKADTKCDTFSETRSDVRAKIEGLSLHELGKDSNGVEDIGEGLSSSTYLLGTEDTSPYVGDSGLDDMSADNDFDSVNMEKPVYNPSAWTPAEVETATGNAGCTVSKHLLKLRSAYAEVEDQSGARDSNGEPLVTSYNRCFLGTVDYIWRSEGLQTVKALAPIPKHAMQWTRGFPTKKWGSDHIALATELAFTKKCVDDKKDTEIQ